MLAMTITFPIRDQTPLQLLLGHLHATLHAAFWPIDDEENESYFDGTSEYTDRDNDDETNDDADDYLDNESDDTEEDDDDLG